MQQTILAHFLDPAAHRAVLRCRTAEDDAGPHGGERSDQVTFMSETYPIFCRARTRFRPAQADRLFFPRQWLREDAHSFDEKLRGPTERPIFQSNDRNFESRIGKFNR